jgi:tricorn protease
MKPRFLAAMVIALVAVPLLAIDIHDTRMLREPAIRGDRIAFAYANDLWTATRDGNDVRRLTSHPGVESTPRFSPDGKLLAFAGEYDGNTDVFVVSVEGGVPKRLTWHPKDDVPVAFTPDGSAVLFTSPRSTYTRRYRQFFTVPVGGGQVTKLPIPNGFDAAYSPDGSKMVYRPLGEVYAQWKNYRGGTTSRLWIYDVKTHAVEQIPQPEGRSNDSAPMWVGNTIYFRSDRDGEFNLYAYDTQTKGVHRLTAHSDFPVESAQAGAGAIVYDQAGYIHRLDLGTGKSQRLKIGVAADLVETRPRFVTGDKWATAGAISPTGARAVLAYRGDIITLPAEKGDDRNLTNSIGAHDRYPAWSPDGKAIAWFSDASGEYQLHVGQQDGKGQPRAIKVAGSGFYSDPKWAPDSKKISYVDNSGTIYIVDLGTGASTRVDKEPMYGPLRTLYHSWSPDSRWLSYSRNTPTYLQQVFLYSLDQNKSFPVTDGLSDASEPAFDAGGKYLYFFSSTDAGPVADWFAQSNADMTMRRSIYMTVLAKGVPSPLARESDEEGAKTEAAAADATKDSKTDEKKDAAPKKDVRVVVDLDGLQNRILALPVESGVYTDLHGGGEGQVFYIKRSKPTGIFDGSVDGSIERFKLEDRKSESIATAAVGYDLSADGKKILIRTADAWHITDAEKPDLTKGKLAVDRIRVKVDPVVEWRQIYDEAWRINRDYFYDPGMHGADWNAIRAKYAAFLPDVPTRADLNRVIRGMASELTVGHSYLGGGDMMVESKPIPGGLLGADYEIANGHYRFAKVFGGLNWTPELRSPLTEPGVDVKAGEYLLAVDGKELAPPGNLYSRFEQTAGRFVELKVGPNPDGTGSRVVKVVPIPDELALRNRAWVEGNMRKVHQATGGRVAYVYVPDTAEQGHEYFKRYFFPQSDKEAIIVDERHNGGGSVADYYVDILRRPFIANWATRYGQTLKSPLASIQGPKVMITDETAGSGGDLLPWMFRKFELGPIVGKRTWGGLVGILGFPDLIDGGSITAPNLAIWTEEGWIVENQGVPPDIEVEQWPADVIAGRDPQLERAIQEAMKALAANPPKKLVQPPFPVRVRK